MKIRLIRSTGVVVSVLLRLLSASLHAQPQTATGDGTAADGAIQKTLLVKQALATNPFSGEIKPQAVLTVMERVADWQLAHESTNRPTGWIQAVGDVGIMALAGISGDAKYRDSMLAKGEQNGWKLPEYNGRKYHADDHCIGQIWTELYFLYRDPKMLAPTRQKFDWIMAHPSTAPSLDFTQPKGKSQELWSWCDALFMAPPTLARLTVATGDERYLNFALTNWWRTTDYLYDQSEHLYFRDSTFFKTHELNGQKIFWSRGNGWVFAATVRMLQYLPTNHRERPRFEKLFKEMAEKLLSLQQPDGLWRASLLDADDYPMPESSGSALYTYGFAWGVNQGLLDRSQYEPAVRKAWPALVGCVEADGKLTHIQPAGDHPVKFEAGASSPYGGGVFLLAGSEVYRMAVLEKFQGKIVTVTNPSNLWRDYETVDVNPEMIVGTVVRGERATLVVMDGMSSRILDSQWYVPELLGQWNKLLFKVDLTPGETQTYYILNSTALAAVPPPIVKTMARYVPERFDDFAWESDRIAHRIYGQALIKAEGTISSGADVWIKKDRGLIVDTMYATKHYHEDNGAFMDDYRVGKSRGCGGLGIWDGKKLFVSSNWKNWKLITTGPIRSEFELTYDAWDAGNGRQVSEVKRFSIDAGSWLTKVSSTISSDDKSPLSIGVGLAERACPTNREEFITHDLTEGWMTYWQPEDQPKGTTAVAILLPKNSVKEFTNDNPTMPESVKQANVPQPTHEGYPPIRTQLAVTQMEVGQPFSYYFGASWDRSGDFTNHVQWENYLRRFAERRDQPLQVTVGN
jgi:rhamnogalacturonyl hydrolase YesR